MVKMPPALEADIIELAQRNFRAYVLWMHPEYNGHLWLHQEWMIPQIQDAVDTPGSQTMITMPPGHSKSTTGFVDLLAWDLARHQTQWVGATATDDLIIKHSGQILFQLESKRHLVVFPETKLRARAQSKHYFELENGSAFRGAGIGGNIEGYRGNLISDDLMKGKDSLSAVKRKEAWFWYVNSFRTRRFNEESVEIHIGTRWHQEDPLGRMLGDSQSSWNHLCLKGLAEVDDPLGREPGEALCPELMSKEALEAERDRAGMNFPGLYQQAPTTPGGDVIKIEWFQRYKKLPDQNEWLQVMASWDTAYTDQMVNDPSACSVWIKTLAGHHYLWWVYRGWWEIEPLLAQALSIAKQHKPMANLVEAKASGKSLVQLMRNRGVPVIEIQPTTNKVAWMWAHAAAIQGGLVYLPEETPSDDYQPPAWLGEFQNELAAFPKGAHDDQVDSVSQYLAYMDEFGQEMSFAVV